MSLITGFLDQHFGTLLVIFPFVFGMAYCSIAFVYDPLETRPILYKITILVGWISAICFILLLLSRI
jgi:hypothetical protein